MEHTIDISGTIDLSGTTMVSQKPHKPRPFLRKKSGKLASCKHGDTYFSAQRKYKIMKEQLKREGAIE